MKLMKPAKITLIGSASFALSTQLGAIVVLFNDFDGNASNDIGPSLQKVDNGVGGSGSFDLGTGVVTTSGTVNSAVGFNTSILQGVPLNGPTISITTTFVVSAANANISANGFFFGLVTGTDATLTTGDALFNNNPAAVGIHLRNGNTAYGNNVNFLQDPDGGSGANIVETVIGTGFPTVASLNDGFTLEFTINNDNSWSATSTGLSNDFTGATGTLTNSNGNADFNTFVSQNFGAYGSIQTTAAGGGFTIDSVEIHVKTIPEPSSLALLAGGLGFCLRRRRK